MHEPAKVSNSVEADGERGKDCIAVARRVAVQRILDVGEARLHRDPVAGQQRNPRRGSRQAFESAEPMVDGELADRVQSCVKIERGNAAAAAADLADARRDLRSDNCDRIKQLSVAPLLAKAIQSIHEDGSVSTLFV